MADRNQCQSCEQFYFCSNAPKGVLCNSYGQILNNSKGLFRRCYTWRGRIRRTEFCISYLIFVIAAILLDIIIEVIGEEYSIAPLVILLMLRILLLLQGIKRSHDMGNSGWWILCPLYNPFFLMFVKGDDGVNEYGSNPKDDYDSQIFEEDKIENVE